MCTGFSRSTLMSLNQKKGSVAEDLACQYLSRQGLSVIERNYRCRVGELDLIMEDGASLVFVEVRSRRDNRYGTSAETITPTKQRRLIRAAQFFLQQRRLDAPCRFDIIAISQERDKLNLEWIKDAFQTP
jgi:putative endonuclease